MSKNIEVVVVDDESSITDLIESYIKFTSKKANVHSFNDSAVAKEYITSNSVDVLITDYKMPNVNGLQLLEATEPDTKKIMISGYVSEIAEERLNSLDVDFYEKPVPMKQIGKIIADSEAEIIDD